jgi:hypothetical protein
MPLLAETLIYGRMKNKLSKIMLQSALLLGSKDEYAVYSANNFINLLKAVFYVSIYFIIVSILKVNGIVFNKYVFYLFAIAIAILSQFFDKEMESQLFRDLESIKNRKTQIGKGVFGIFILFLSIALLVLIGSSTVGGYAKLK